MRMTTKAALAALALAGAAAAATPATAQQFGLGFGPNGGISFSYDSGGYCDQFGCPDDFWDMPVYYGPVFYAGQWYDGPVYYRDGRRGREYWVHGGWRRDEWRGPRPGWWREGRYGPPLGMDYYRQHDFHGRWGSGRDFGRDRGPNFGPRGDDRGPNFGPRNDNRGGNFGPRDDRNDNRGDDRRGFNQPGGQDGPGNAPRAFDPRSGRSQRWGQPGAAPAAAPAPAAPAPAAPAPAAAPAGAPAGNGDRGGHRGPPQP